MLPHRLLPALFQARHPLDRASCRGLRGILGAIQGSRWGFQQRWPARRQRCRQVAVTQRAPLKPLKPRHVPLKLPLKGSSRVLLDLQLPASPKLISPSRLSPARARACRHRQLKGPRCPRRFSIADLGPTSSREPVSPHPTSTAPLVLHRSPLLLLLPPPTVLAAHPTTRLSRSATTAARPRWAPHLHLALGKTFRHRRHTRPYFVRALPVLVGIASAPRPLTFRPLPDRAREPTLIRVRVPTSPVHRKPLTSAGHRILNRQSVLIRACRPPRLTRASVRDPLASPPPSAPRASRPSPARRRPSTAVCSRLPATTPTLRPSSNNSNTSTTTSRASSRAPDSFCPSRRPPSPRLPMNPGAAPSRHNRTGCR